MANNEQHEKVELEKEFRINLQKIFDSMTKDYVADILTIEDYDIIFDKILLDQYELVGNIFSSKMGSDLPSDTKPTDLEIEEILAALALFYLVRAPKQRKIIQDTTKKNVIQADKFGREYATEQALAGIIVTADEQRIVAGNKLNSHFKNRSALIAGQETQAIAETAKAAEVSILAGRQPDFIAPDNRNVGVSKIWNTQRDEKVRRYSEDEFDHVIVDLQKVDMNKPFDVSGESMMYPTDENLGASAGNIIGCRCYTEYDRSDLIKLRKEAL